MTDVTVKLLAEEIHTSVDRLVQQLANAGIYKSEVDFVNQNEKEILLAYLKHNRGNTPNRLTLQRKTRSTLSVPITGGKNRSVQIEIRKKRTYVQTDINIEKISELEEKNSKINKKQVNKTDNILNKNEFKKIAKHEINKKNKHIRINKDKNTFDNKINQIVIEKNNVNKEKIYTTSKLEQIAEKARREAESAELIKKAEQEMCRKIEENARLVAEEARRMAEENGGTWIATPVSIEEDLSDYHVTTSKHAREAEDENDRKVEGERRTRTRSSKISKHKKNSRMFDSKSDREEARIVHRGGKGKNKTSTLMQCFNKPIQIVNRDVVIGDTITIAELANKMAVKSSQVIKAMIKLGSMATINQIIDQTTAQLIAEEMGHKVILRHENDLEESVMNDRDIGAPGESKLRAPIVTIMGHVDHGKTSLLDCIRSSKIVDSEAGGITQHIGAYHVKTKNGAITFLDTPGHAAFTAMRSRGTQVTDIVVLVVAADDGAMPQTIEAIQHAKSADVPIVVAVNKIDKPESDTDRVKNELAKYGIISDEWGGDNQFINVSAKSGIGISDLLNAILLQAELLELKAVSQGMASGVVIESFLSKGSGPVSTILVREGVLNRGDIILCGIEYGRIRAMRNEKGHEITSAGPSIPVEILGLSGVPESGNKATVVRSEKKAREVALYRKGKFREMKLARQQKSKLENMFSDIKEGKASELNIVLKSDVQGSVEAISDALQRLSTSEVKIKISGSGVGGITETDATLAAASNAILIGFNVRADAIARRIIEEENLDIQYYSIIYDLIDKVKKAMNGMLSPEYKQEIIGLAEVRNVFGSPKFGAVAGCIVIEGIVQRHKKIRVLRNHIVIYEGELESLRRFKNDVTEVRNGVECGIGIKNYNDIKSGDVIEVFENIEIKRTIS